MAGRSRRSRRQRELAWLATAAGSAMLAELLARQLFTRTWHQMRDDESPIEPGRHQQDWRWGLAWATATGAAVGALRFLAHRGADAGWRRVTGSAPPR